MGGNRWVATIDGFHSCSLLLSRHAHTQPFTTWCCDMLGCTAAVNKQKAAEEAAHSATLQKEEERKLRTASRAAAEQAELVRCKSRESFVGIRLLTWLKQMSMLYFTLTL